MIGADSIQLTLSRPEALVLFEWLSRIDEPEGALIEHPAEQKVRWRLQGQLEAALHEPFADNYKDLLDQARDAVSRG